MMKANEHLLNGLLNIYEYFSYPKNVSLTGLFSTEKLPKDYAKMLVNDGIILNITGRKTGINKYGWVGKKPTLTLASAMLSRYNEQRRIEAAKIRQTNRNTLEMLHRKIDLIMAKLEIYDTD